jgi:hypothetical protein
MKNKMAVVSVLGTAILRRYQFLSFESWEEKQTTIWSRVAGMRIVKSKAGEFGNRQTF